MTRAPGLQRLVNAAEQALAGADLSLDAQAAIRKVFGRLTIGQPMGQVQAENLPVLSLLPLAVANLHGYGQSLQDLGLAVQALSPSLGWSTRKSVGLTASAGFETAHANAVLIGPGGLEPREDVWVGLSLMAPHTRYPDHNHAPEEVYLVLSDGAFLQGDADWLQRAPGQTVYNTPWVRHAMRATDQPFLALWCLPL